MYHAPGWYPAPNGEPLHWFWDGAGWLDPTEDLATYERRFEDHLAELLTPIANTMFIEGVKHGLHMAQSAAGERLERTELLAAASLSRI